MKTHRTLSLSAVFAGAMAGWFVTQNPTQATTVAQRVAGSAAVVAQIGKAIVGTGGKALAEVNEELVAFALNATGVTPSGQSNLMLAERVVILYGPTAQYTELPAGTPVRLVADNGRFLQVSHAANVVTIPRSAAVGSAVRVN